MHCLRNAACAATIAILLPACAPDASDALCSAHTLLGTMPAPLDEASGIAVSTAHPGILWAHNDSEGTPLLYALDTDGGLVAEIDVSRAAEQSDWEDIDVAPCPAGSCIFVADIGDNLHDREDRAILRFAEPDPDAADAGVVDRFPIRYPDGPRDAEAMFVADGTLYVISKGRRGPVTLYRYPPPLRADERITLEPVQELTDGLQQLPDLVTGASAHADGRVVVIRTYSALQFHAFDGDSLAAQGDTIDLIPLAEPQGEGVAIDGDGAVYLVSEVGPGRAPTRLARLTCRLP